MMSTIESDANLLDDRASELDGSEPRLLEASFEEVRQFLLASGLPEDVVETFRLQGLDSMALVADLEEHHMRDLGLSLSESLKLRRALAKRSSASSRPAAATTVATAARTGNGGSSSSNEGSTDRSGSNSNRRNNNTTATAPASARSGAGGAEGNEQAREAVNDVGGSVGVGGGAQRDTPSNTKSSAPGLPILALLVAALVVVLGVAVWKEQHWSKTEADLRRQLLHSEEQRAQAQSTFQEQISELKELLHQSTNQFRESRDKDLQRQAWTLPGVTKAPAQEPTTWSSSFRNFVSSTVTKVLAWTVLWPWLSALSFLYLEAWKDKEFVNEPITTIVFALFCLPVPFLGMLLMGWSCWFLFELAAATELLLVIGWAIYGMWEHRLTFLHVAAAVNMPLLAYLLCYSTICDINAKSGDGCTPLDMATSEVGREAVAAVLKEFGAKKAEELTKS